MFLELCVVFDIRFIAIKSLDFLWNDIVLQSALSFFIRIRIVIVVRGLKIK
jgi:hypothetical protein